MSLLLLFRSAATAIGWTWDANHFTLDDNTNHKMDGWHIDGPVSVEVPHGGGVDVARELRRRQLEDDDRVILAVIQTWLKKAA